MFAYHIVLLAMADRDVRHMDGWMMSCRMIAYDDVVKRRTTTRTQTAMRGLPIRTERELSVFVIVSVGDE